MLGAALQFDKPAVVGHDDVEIDFRRRIADVVEIERRSAAANPHRNRSHAVNDRILFDRAGLEEPADGDLQRHHAAGNRSAARPAVRLQHVAVDRDLALAELLHIDRRAQRPSDEPLDFRRTRVHFEFFDVAFLAPAAGGGRQHGIFGRNPASAGIAQKRRNLLFHAGGTEHPRVAPFYQHAAGGVFREIADDFYRTEFIALFHG